MNIRHSVLGQIASRSGNQVTGIEAGTLLRRLLLFDTVVIDSAGLYEISHLVRLFGKSGFLELLNSNVLKICCALTYVISPKERNGKPVNPPCHFSFGIAEVQSRDQVFKRGLCSLQGIAGLKNAERQNLEESVISGLLRPDSGYGPQLQKQLEIDIRNNSPALRAAIEEQLRKQFGEPLQPFEVKVEETDTRVFHVATDISKVYGLSEQETHELLHTSVFGVANLNTRIADMEAYSSIVGFKETEATLLFGKFAGILGPQNPKPMEEQFARVISIANLPDALPGTSIDVEKLLLVRKSTECSEFRLWLTTLNDVSDKKITEMVGAMRSKIGSIIRSGPGKTLRLAATTALGLIPGYGLAAGPAAGALDSFLLEKLFPTSGVAAFLSKTYPSLFDHQG